MIEQFIQQATNQLGINQSDAEQATSGLLSLLKSQANSSDFSSLLSQIPGAEDLMNKFEVGNDLASNSGSGNSGLLGGLMGTIGDALGDSSLGNVAGIAGLLSQINLDSDKLGSLTSMFFDFIKNQSSEDLTKNIMESYSSLLGGNKAA